jgi:hypothetical protein
MPDYHRDIMTAFQGTDGRSRWKRILWDDEIKVLYFEDHASSVVEVWLNPSENRRDDFGVWGNNSLNNDHAVVLWEET